MTPTIVLKNGKPFLVTGSPGGSRIITAVLQVLLNVIDHRMTIAEAVQAPRMPVNGCRTRRWWKPAVPAEIVKALEARGHHVEGVAAVRLGQLEASWSRRAGWSAPPTGPHPRRARSGTCRACTSWIRLCDLMSASLQKAD